MSEPPTKRRRVEEKTQTSEVETSRLARVPARVMRSVMLPFLTPPNRADLATRCRYYTQHGTRCGRSLRYQVEDGAMEDCTAYCATRCKHWLYQLLADVPARVLTAPLVGIGRQFELRVTHINVLLYRGPAANYQPARGWWMYGQPSSPQLVADALCMSLRPDAEISLRVSTERPDVKYGIPMTSEMRNNLMHLKVAPPIGGDVLPAAVGPPTFPDFAGGIWAQPKRYWRPTETVDFAYRHDPGRVGDYVFVSVPHSWSVDIPVPLQRVAAAAKA